MCGCGKKKVTKQQVDVQVAMIEQVRAQTTNLAESPRSARRAAVAVTNVLAKTRCKSSMDCPDGEVCANGYCKQLL